MTRDEFKAVCMKHCTVVAGYEFADRFDFDAIYGECGFDSAREQAIEAAAYRKAAELCKNTLLHTLDPGNRIRDGILALIAPSAQSALESKSGGSK